LRDYRFRAFIAYSHADRRIAEELQRSLEAFAVPSRLVGQPTPFGPAPKRLTPIFRDRSDLSAAGDLSEELDAALKDSLFLVVVCSPATPQSAWVAEEIRRFKVHYGEKRVLAAIFSGEPKASDELGRTEQECFPKTLRYQVGADGAVSDRPSEPLAADFREDQDGPKLARLKLAAGLLGLPLDQLVQREAQRRAVRMQLVAAGLAGLAAAMGFLAFDATMARREAVKERNEAQSLIEFMLTDLRAKLEPVGRLDALEVLGERTLQYYAKKDAKALDPDALGLRSRAQLLVGEIDNLRGDLDAALKAYKEAAATTEEQLRRAPNDAQRIFDHAQSVFWVGEIAWQRGAAGKAETQFKEYLRLAERLVELDPDKPEWRLEIGYATTNLGMLADEQGDFATARALFLKSAETKQALLKQNPGDLVLVRSLGQSYSWLARVQMNAGAFTDAAATLRNELALYERPLADDPANVRFLAPWCVAIRAFAKARTAGAGAIDEAYQALIGARSSIERLVSLEPENLEFRIRVCPETSRWIA